MNTKERLTSLDVLRGLTVMLMIVVNNQVGEQVFSQLSHAEWNGLTCCDLVYPFFLFCVGVSINLSHRQTAGSIAIRAAKIFGVGLLLMVCNRWLRHNPATLADFRFWGVLQRIAVCYLLAGITYLYVPKRWLWSVIALLLAAYGAILLMFNGYAQDATNIARIIDVATVGEAHLYNHAAIDPEGLLGTMSATAHTLIGVVAGGMLKEKHLKLCEKMLRMLVFGALLIAGGLLTSMVLPINKTVWSPSYALLTCGIAAVALSALMYVCDYKQITAWSTPARWFGVNPIVLFALGGLCAPFMPTQWLYDTYNSAFGMPDLASLAYTLTFLIVLSLIAWGLWKKSIYVRL